MFDEKQHRAQNENNKSGQEINTIDGVGGWVGVSSVKRKRKKEIKKPCFASIV